MNEILFCPNCHQPIEATNFFCSNCGKKIKNPPLSTSISSQIFLYLKTLILPPFGLIWGYRYFRQPDSKSKLIGIFTIIITIIETIWLIQSTMSMVDTLNSQIYQQYNLYGL